MWLFLWAILMPVCAQDVSVSGIVTDREHHQPIVGASVAVKGTARGVITDMEGRFRLTGISAGSVLTVSYLGYRTQTVQVKNGKITYSVVLQEDSQALNEVVVVGFGTQKKANLTGAVSSVDVRELRARPVAQVGQALQGAVPGLNIDAPEGGGALGKDVAINIRGIGTIGQGSIASPLILIDGIEGNMNTLNPDDIESISVLKDAASSSIYGSRAAFGVILISTKKGRAGRMSVNYNNSFRYSGPVGLPRVLDSYRFANYFNEASINQGDGRIFDDDVMQRIQDYMAGKISATTIAGGTNWEQYDKANDNVNWYRKHLKWAWSQEHTLSLNGGTDRLQYYVSGSYLNQNGNLHFGNDNMKRYNLAAKVNARINRFLDFNLNTRFIRLHLDNPLFLERGSMFSRLAQMWPTMPFQDPNGHYMRYGKIPQLKDGGRINTSNDNLYLQGQFVVHPLKNWNIYLEAGMRVVNEHKQNNLNPIYEYLVDGSPQPLAFSPAYSPGASYAAGAFSTSDFFTTSVYSDYTLTLGRHYFKFMLGMNTEEYKNRALSAQRDNVITPAVPEISAAIGIDKINTASVNDWATAGFFGRINYVFADRYLLEMNLRYDGSSRFLRNQRWNMFPSFSVGWNMAQEDFFRPLTSVVNTLKPRLSWGMLGNQNTSSFYPFYLTQGIAVNAGNWMMDGVRPTTSWAPGLVSSTLTWEKVYNTNIGLDFGMFDNRLTGYLEYFVRDTKDMVGPPEEIGATLGVPVLPDTNNATLRNTGWDLQINWRDRIGQVNYNVGFNLSDNRVFVKKFPNESLSLNSFYKGMELGEIWGYETHGIAKTQDEMDTWLATHDQKKLGSEWGAGDVMYEDLDGNHLIDKGSNTLTDHGDLKVIGNSNPRFRFGINLGAEWKGIDVRLFLQGVMKRDVWLDGPMFWGAHGGKMQAMGLEEHLDYFRPEDTQSVFGPNTDAYYPRPYIGSKGYKDKYVQSRYLQNASYLRLKNIQIGYALPQRWMRRIHLQHMRIFFSGENLLTFCRMPDMYDPETTGPNGSGITYPLSKTVAFGLNVTL